MTKLNFHTITLVSMVIITLILCLLPFMLNGPHPLGYDTGFYRRYLINPSVSIPNTAVPGLDHTIIAPRIFLDIIQLFGLNPDITLYGSYIFITIILAVTFYFFVKEYTNKNVAIIATFLLVISPIQYLAYWFMFYKNFFSLILFFLCLIFLRRKNFIPSLIFALLIPLSHQTTTIIFLGILGVYIFITLIKDRKFLIPELIILALTLFVYLYLHPHVQQKIDAPPVGIFIEKMNFLFMTLPLILLTLAGLPKFFTILKQNSLLVAFGFVGIIFPLFSLPYYQRIFLFTNYWLILGAAVGIYSLMSYITNKKRFYKWVSIGLTATLIFHTVLLIKQVNELKPLITPEVVEEITKMTERVPAGSSILTAPRLTPWVQGWTTAKVYAPGILKDSHPSQEWQQYWSGASKEKIDFLSTFPEPLYIFVDESQKDLYIPKSSCVKKISEMLYLKDCHTITND